MLLTGYHNRRSARPRTRRIPSGSPSARPWPSAKRSETQRRALGLSVAELAGRADRTADEIECIEEGGTEPAIALLRRLSAALDADVRLTSGYDLCSVWFDPHAA